MKEADLPHLLDVMGARAMDLDRKHGAGSGADLADAQFCIAVGAVAQLLLALRKKGVLSDQEIRSVVGEDV